MPGKVELLGHLPVCDSYLIVEKVNKPTAPVCWLKMAISRCTLREGAGAAKHAPAPPTRATGLNMKMLNKWLVNNERLNKGLVKLRMAKRIVEYESASPVASHCPSVLLSRVAPCMAQRLLRNNYSS